MNNEEYIPLNRQFSLVAKNDNGIENEDFNYSYGRLDTKSWDELGSEFRCVILAEAGAGKTEELRNRAKSLQSEGQVSFFIRIEDIEASFYEAFDIGTKDQFQEWLESTEEAWFFLDSVDESRLESPKAFEKALRCFSKGIRLAAHRAHIILSSRPYAWRPIEDRKVFDRFLPLSVPNDNREQGSNPKSALNIYVMQPLDSIRVRQFSEAREAEDIDQLLIEVERTNLWSLAERPFDLDGILSKWLEDRALGGRLELLRHNIDKRLRDDHNCDRSQQRILTLERAKEGARRLAAAVVLTGEAGIHIPDSTTIKSGIDAEAVLADWPPAEVRSLVDLGVFNDLLFNVVRFRHREVGELLAAEWFNELLKVGSRHEITELFIHEKYGEEIVTLRLRSILPWLILFDSDMRNRTLDLHPEIALEGGDPSKLPLAERKIILAKIVNRIVSNEDDHSARDNSAIARIASRDLSENTFNLIEQYRDDDEAIFFLGRLVWQGDMKDCVSSMIEIAADPLRGIYARIASARAVMSCGNEEQKIDLWQRVNEDESEIPYRLLPEFIDNVEPSIFSGDSIIKSIDKLPGFDRYEYSGVNSSIHDYIEKIDFVDDQNLAVHILKGLHGFLDKSPYIERGECHVSEDYAWLINHAIHLLEKLIEIRHEAVLGKIAISILLMVPALKFWRSDDLREQNNKLEELVPQWPELNDILYWKSIEQAKNYHLLKKESPLVDDWSVSWLDHFWMFDKVSLLRLFKLLHSKTCSGDRLIVLSTVFRVYIKSDRDDDILSSIKNEIINDIVLTDKLEQLLNPVISEALKQREIDHAEHKQKCDAKDAKRKEDKSNWILGLKENPNRLFDNTHIEVGECTNDLIWLLEEISGKNLSTNRSEGADWEALTPEFGHDVAVAYRESLIKLWRQYKPTLQSEGVIRDNSIPWSLILSLSGLEIESVEGENFPFSLNEIDVKHMLRYLTWDMNGFPSWFEKVYKAFPLLAQEAVKKELIWELENVSSNTQGFRSYILSDLAHSAQWIHNFIAPIILTWLKSNPSRINENKNNTLKILIAGGVEALELVKLANLGLAESRTLDEMGWWFAILVDCSPDEGIPKLKNWLSKQSSDKATNSAQIFITALMGNRYSINQGSNLGLYRTPKHLKELYVLMHHYIPATEDIDRTGGGVFSPGLRDDAQDARNNLFNLLSAIPGKTSYTLIKKLEEEHPDTSYRPWMAKRAYKRAEEDGDLVLWSGNDVRAFNDKQLITPKTHEQLFRLTANRLIDLKNWLERGNDSPWQTWQRVASENEMRNLIAGWLNMKCGNHYTTAQEPELANSQRMDIWLHNTNVQSPVPIELKLLDKKWTGPDLCERLRNQLAGDYLREESASCGVMLLVASDLDLNKKWKINNKMVKLGKLSTALKAYWDEIAIDYPNVLDIEIIVIDLNQRKYKCDT